MDRTHLIGDWTNAADARCNIGRLRIMPAAQQGFKQTRRFIDIQGHVSDVIAPEFDIESALALDSRQCIDTDGLRRLFAHARSASSPAFRNCQAQALKPRKARVISGLVWPRIRNWLESEIVFGV